MANIYTNPTLSTRPDTPGAPADSYSGYKEPDTSVPPKAKPVMEAVSVNGTVIPEEDILAEAQNHPAETPGEAVKAAKRALVVRELLLQEAKDQGVTGEPETDETGRPETAEDAAIRELMDRDVTVPMATDDECRRYFEQNTSKFRTQPLYEARHILLAARPEDKVARDKAKRQAQTLCKTLRNDPSGFSAAAAEFSACSSQGEGGRLGQLSKGDTVDAFDQALEALKEGDITAEPVETDFGFHVIALDRKIPGRDLPFEQAREKIAAWLEAASWSRAVSQYITILAAKAELTGIDLQEVDGPLVQ